MCAFFGSGEGSEQGLALFELENRKHFLTEYLDEISIMILGNVLTSNSCMSFFLKKKILNLNILSFFSLNQVI